MKEFLSREGVRFVVRNVEEDHAAYDELVAQGFRAVPVTFIDGTPVAGFDPQRLRAVLSTRESSAS